MRRWDRAARGLTWGFICGFLPPLATELQRRHELLPHPPSRSFPPPSPPPPPCPARPALSSEYVRHPVQAGGGERCFRQRQRSPPTPPQHTHTYTHLTTATGSPSSQPPKAEEEEKRRRGKPGADRREGEELRVGHFWSWGAEEKRSAPPRFSPPHPLCFSLPFVVQHFPEAAAEGDRNL